jgi:hypothetical protein
LFGEGFILPEHVDLFAKLNERLENEVIVRNSSFGDYMEARLFADLARYKLENKYWEIPEVVEAGKDIICGVVAYPSDKKDKYDDCVNRAVKGWQDN